MSMDFQTDLREIFTSQPVQYSQQNYIRHSMKDIDLTFGVPSSQGFYQDFHHVDQFHVNGISSSNQVFGVQNPTLDSFDNFTYGCSSAAGFDVYECKPFVDNNGGGHAHVMDNFQYGGYGLNLPQRNQLDMMVSNQSYVPFSIAQETKPVNFVVPDEVSCISPVNYYKRVAINKNNKEYPTSRRTYRLRKKSNIVKGQWTEAEDSLLIQLVEQHGLRKWSQIAQMLPGRIGKQCRERWHNHLRPDIKKDIWTDEEDKILIEAHAEIGNKWAEIAKRLAGRTENSIKNHWNATKRRQYSKRKCRTKYTRGSILQEYIKSLNLDKNPPIDYRRRSAKARAMTNKTSTSKVAPPPPPPPAQPQIEDNQFSTNDRLVPNYDFNEVPDFCFDENLFEEGCSIDSLLDDIACAPIMDDKELGGKMQGAPNNVEGNDFDHGAMQCAPVVNLDDNDFEADIPQEIMESMMGGGVKKELDLVEMMSQVNKIVDV